jgi:cobalamin transport system substrate-binding protein
MSKVLPGLACWRNLLLALTCGLTACDFSTAEGDPLSQTNSTANSGPVSATQATAAAKSPKTVVVGPSSAETLFWLGLQAYVIGVSDFCLHSDAADLPRVGGQQDPNLELIATLAPELVVVQGAHPQLQSWCESNGVKFVAFKTQSLDSWREEVRSYGRLFGIPARAEEKLAAFQAELDGLLTEVNKPGEADPAYKPGLRTLIVAYRKPDQIAALMVASNRSFLGELLEIVGGKNIYADHPKDYFDLNAEALLAVEPEIIFELGGTEDARARLEMWRRDFPTLPATRNGRIYGLTDYRVYLPGPGMLETARLMRQALR